MRTLQWFLNQTTDGRFKVEEIVTRTGAETASEWRLYQARETITGTVWDDCGGAFDSAREARAHAQRLAGR